MTTGQAAVDKGQAPESAEKPQAGNESGQEQLSGDELKKLVADLRKENAKYRTTARDAEKQRAEFEQQQQAAAEAEAKRRGEFEKLHAAEKQKAEQLARELDDERFSRHFEKALGKYKPREGALEDIQKLFPREGGKIEGLDERLAEFRASKPYLFEPDPPATGLPGYRPGAGATSQPAAGEADIAEAARRQMKLPDWLALKAKVEAAKTGKR